MHTSTRPSIRLGLAVLLLGAGACEPKYIGISPIPAHSASAPDVLGAAVESAQAGVNGYLALRTWRELADPLVLAGVEAEVLAQGDVSRRDILLQIAPIFAEGLTVPDAVESRTTLTPQQERDLWSDPATADAFCAFYTGQIYPMLSRHPTNDYVISVGNEVDFRLSTQQAWAEYTQFYERAVACIKSHDPLLLVDGVGVTATLYGGRTQGAMGFGVGIPHWEQDQLLALVAFSDVIVWTYYPTLYGEATGPYDTGCGCYPPMPFRMEEVAGLFGGWVVPNDLTWIKDFRQMADDKPTLIQEIGYPTHPSLHTLDVDQQPGDPYYDDLPGWAKHNQQVFFEQFIDAWNAGAKDTIDGFNVFALHDFETILSEDPVACGGAAPCVIDCASAQSPVDRFNCTFGLLDAQGNEKPAWPVVRDKLASSL